MSLRLAALCIILLLLAFKYKFCTCKNILAFSMVLDNEVLKTGENPQSGDIQGRMKN